MGRVLLEAPSLPVRVAPILTPKSVSGRLLSGSWPYLIWLPLFTAIKSLFRKRLLSPSALNYCVVYFPTQDFSSVSCVPFVFVMHWENWKLLFSEAQAGCRQFYSGSFTTWCILPPRQSLPGPSSLLELLLELSTPCFFQRCLWYGLVVVYILQYGILYFWKSIAFY